MIKMLSTLFFNLGGTNLIFEIFITPQKILLVESINISIITIINFLGMKFFNHYYIKVMSIERIICIKLSHSSHNYFK